MVRVLRPGELAAEQWRLVLSGMGSIGKTQLAIAYARRCQKSYTSVFWLNATSELTLEASFRLIAEQLFLMPELAHLDDEKSFQAVCWWLSGVNNTMAGDLRQPRQSRPV